MAHCVISMTVDSDHHDAFVASCMVHTRRAPCPCDGEPANPLPLHTWTDQAFEDSLRMWKERTHGQRPLLAHNGAPDDNPQHDLTPRCWCEPLRLSAFAS